MLSESTIIEPKRTLANLVFIMSSSYEIYQKRFVICYQSVFYERGLREPSAAHRVIRAFDASFRLSIVYTKMDTGGCKNEDF